MRKRTVKPAPELKNCPFNEDKCLGPGCMIFHEQFSKCYIEVLTFNLFKLSSALQNMDDTLPPIKG